MKLSNLTQEEKIARKRKQKAEAQKRYYQKNKEYYKNYNKENPYAKKFKEENELLKKKLDKAIELLIEYNTPCEMNDFMNKNVDYCSSNCGVDEEVYKKCWLRYIEQELMND